MLLLEGIRILDLSRYWAGPLCGWFLANMGAEVIKIESCSSVDHLRVEPRMIYPEGEAGERPWNRSGMINERNRDKYGITLDLATAKGKDVFLKLVKISDVVIENFQVNVVTKLGVDYPVLVEVNPAIIMMSLASQGLTGPEKHYRSFGPNLEQVGGLTSITGYAGDPPYISSLAFPDPLGGMYGAGLILAALNLRRSTGRGVHIDLSQREAVTCVIGEAIMDYSLNRRVWSATGNRHPFMAPHGCYRCQGQDSWVSIAVCNDKQWKALCEIMDMAELAEDERFSDTLSRYNNQDELDHIIEEWTSKRDHYEIQSQLQRAGIAAGAVLNAKEIHNNLQLEERHFFESVLHPEAGNHSHPGLPMKFSKTPSTTRMPAPCLGEHNEYVYGKLLGLTKAEIDELEKEGVIGYTPKENR